MNVSAPTQVETPIYSDTRHGNANSRPHLHAERSDSPDSFKHPFGWTGGRAKPNADGFQAAGTCATATAGKLPRFRPKRAGTGPDPRDNPQPPTMKRAPLCALARRETPPCSEYSPKTRMFLPEGSLDRERVDTSLRMEDLRGEKRHGAQLGSGPAPAPPALRARPARHYSAAARPPPGPRSGRGRGSRAGPAALLTTGSAPPPPRWAPRPRRAPPAAAASRPPAPAPSCQLQPQRVTSPGPRGPRPRPSTRRPGLPSPAPAPWGTSSPWLASGRCCAAKQREPWAGRGPGGNPFQSGSGAGSYGGERGGGGPRFGARSPRRRPAAPSTRAVPTPPAPGWWCRRARAWARVSEGRLWSPGILLVFWFKKPHNFRLKK